MTIDNKKLKKKIYFSAILSLIFYSGSIFLIPKTVHRQNFAEILSSAKKMARAIKVIKEHCIKNQIPFDPQLDPNQTGLIGTRTSILTTTLGNLNAKRTTTNPNIAGLITSLLTDTKIKPGQSVAIGGSASFPGLVIASLIAVETLNINPILIISLGASSYGANNPNLTILDILEILNNQGIIKTKPHAISLGGDLDVGKNFPNSFKKILIRKILDSQIPFIYDPNLESNVKKRMTVFLNNSPNHHFTLFINIGGNFANLGTSSKILKLSPGINYQADLPQKGKRGLIFEVLSRKIPCLHLLYIKGFTQKYGLPWDPIPIPKPDPWSFGREKTDLPKFMLFLFIIYIILLSMIWNKL